MQEGVEIIEYGAFMECNNLTTVEMANTIKKIAANAFDYCSSLTNIEINNENNKNFNFQDGILIDVTKNEMIIILPSAINGEHFVIPNGIKKLQGNQLERYPQIKSITIPNSVTEIMPDFINKNIEKVNFEAENEKYEIYKNGIYEKINGVRSKIIRYYGNETNVRIEEGIKTIGRICFKDKNITNINLPNTLEEIERQAFQNTNITTLKLEKNIKKLDSLFSYFSNITEILIDEENIHYMVENDILYSKDNSDSNKELLLLIEPVGTVKEFEIPYGVTKIGNEAFYNQNNMKKIVIPDTVKEIGTRAFGYCESLTKVEIPNSVNLIGPSCFESCSNLNEIIINKAKGEIEGAPWGANKGDRVIFWLK